MPESKAQTLVRLRREAAVAQRAGETLLEPTRVHPPQGNLDTIRDARSLLAEANALGQHADGIEAEEIEDDWSKVEVPRKR